MILRRCGLCEHWYGEPRKHYMGSCQKLSTWVDRGSSCWCDDYEADIEKILKAALGEEEGLVLAHKWDEVDVGYKI